VRIVIGRLVAAALLAFALAGCGPATSTMGTGLDGLRTYSWTRQVLCTLGKSIPPFAGTLRGQQGTRELVWIEGPAGEHWSIVWPAGFTVAFTPAAELRNERGDLVGRDGDAIELDQVSLGQATGTYDDPYLATGLFAGGCYLFVSG